MVGTFLEIERPAWSGPGCGWSRGQAARRSCQAVDSGELSETPAAGPNAGLDERGRERGEVGALVGPGGHRPDAAPVARWAARSEGLAAWHGVGLAAEAAALHAGPEPPLWWRTWHGATHGRAVVQAGRRLLHGIAVEEVARTFGQQEQVLVGLGAAVRHALRHRVRLVPDDVLAQMPAIGPEREGQHPGDADEVLVLRAFRGTGRALCMLVSVFGRPLAVQIAIGAGLGAVRPAGVAGPDVEPQRAIVGEHVPHAAEHLDHGRDVLLRRLLQTQLAGMAVVAQSEVGRADDAHLGADALGRPRAHGVSAVAGFDGVHMDNP